jgi:hypothetical protein
VRKKRSTPAGGESVSRSSSFPARKRRGFSRRTRFRKTGAGVIPIQNDIFRLWIGCGNYDEYPDGFLCLIDPHQPAVRKFLFFGTIDTTDRVSALQRAVDEILSANPDVLDRKWRTYEEFTSPRSS